MARAEPRDPEIGDLRDLHLFSVQKDVARLQIAMHDARVV
jgi:hypothetical protein